MEGHLANAIQILPQGTRRSRCCELLEYHRGVFFDAYGLFGPAASAQARAAGHADSLGDRSSAAVCRFMEAVYRLKQALCECEPGTLYWSVLESRFAQVVEATRGSALEVQWAQGNGPWHMLQACLWLDLVAKDPEGYKLKWEAWTTIYLAAAKKLGKAWEPAAQLVSAVDSDFRGDQGAEAQLSVISSDPGQTSENRAMALLVLMRAGQLARRGELGFLQALFAKMPEIGVQHVRAVAERLLG